MQFSSQHLHTLLKKLVQGAATEDERKQISEYLSKNNGAIDPDLLLTFKEWESIDEEDDLPEGLKDRIVTRIAEFELKESAETILISSTGGRLKMLSWLAACAAALLLLFIGQWFFAHQKMGGKVTFMTVKAAKGERKTIKLPDSSVVYLNAGSELTYPVKFVHNQRHVQLTGEAFFKVMRDTSKPFIVQSDMLEITVLGTSFNVHAYPDEEKLSVTVATGSVKVQSKKSGTTKDNVVLLSPGLQTVYGKEMANFIVHRVNPEFAYSWKDDRLFFEQVSLEEICSILGRKYNVVFKAQDPELLKYKFSATFEHINLRESLDKLEVLGDIQFITGDTIIIKGQPSN